MSDFRSGFVALIGYPNVGKSTLLNTLVGAKISIVTKKPQTTRTRISGVVTKKDCQIIFVDTPGIHEGPSRLDRFMERTAESAITDVDVVLYMVDARTGVSDRDETILSKIRRSGMPYVIAVNKIDAVSDRDIEKILGKFGEDERVCLISAATGQGVDELFAVLGSYMLPGPKYYPDDDITDQPLSLIISEIVREKALKHLGKEVPHGIGVNTEKVYRNEKGVTEIEAVIYCEKESHKGIIIGAGGSRLKKIATEARMDIEQYFDGKIYIRLWVKVKEDWRNQASVLKILGYTDE